MCMQSTNEYLQLLAPSAVLQGLWALGDNWTFGASRIFWRYIFSNDTCLTGHTNLLFLIIMHYELS